MENSKIKELFVKNQDKIIEYGFLFLLSISSFLYFLSTFSDGLSKGGRWDLGQHIAMADRFLEGKGFYYSPLEASTPYFPGVAFLSIIIGKIFGAQREWVMLLIASFIGVAFFLLLVWISQEINKNKWIALFVGVYFFYFCFDDYKYYMNEFKADTLVLFFAVILVVILGNIIDNEKELKWYLFVILLVASFLMDITKQQALYVDVAIGIFLLFVPKLSIKKKIYILIPLVLAGIIVMIILFNIQGFSLITIENLKNMPYWSQDDMLDMVLTCIEKNKLFFVFIVLFFILCLLKKVKMSSTGWMWLFISISFGIGQLLGGLKRGGNNGNFEVGMVPFIPFIAYTIWYLVKEFIVANKRKYLLVIGGILLFVAFRNQIYDLSYTLSYKCSNRIHSNQDIVEYLNKNYSGKEILYSSDYYIPISLSEALPSVDYITIPLYCDGYQNRLEDILNNREYEILLIDSADFSLFDSILIDLSNHDSSKVDALKNNYEVVEDENMPDCLRGHLYKAKE